MAAFADPVTITFPGCARTRSTARINSASSLADARRMESASISIAARAAASQSFSGPELMGSLHHRMIDIAYRGYQCFRFHPATRCATI
jgi:glucan biosynthesis protein